jgi:hypothetical protein
MTLGARCLKGLEVFQLLDQLRRFTVGVWLGQCWDSIVNKAMYAVQSEGNERLKHHH